MADNSEKRILLLRKKELLLKKAQTRKRGIIEKAGIFAKEQFPEIVEEAQGRTAGLVPPELSAIGARIKEAAPEVVRPALETAAETVRGGILPAIVPGGRTTIEKPGIAARAAALVAPITRAPEIAGAAARLGVQQIIPTEESQIPGQVAEVVGGLTFAGIRSLGKAAVTTRAKALTASKNAVDDIKKIGDDLSSTITETMASKTGDKAVDVAKASKALKDLPENVINKITKESNIFKVEFLPDGTLKPSLRNMWRLRQALDDFLTRREFLEGGKKLKVAIRTSRNLLAKLMRDSDAKISPIMKAFSEFTKKSEPVLDILTGKGGKAIANKLITAVGGKGEPAQKLAIKALQRQIPTLRKAAQTAKATRTGEIIRKGAGVAALTGAAAATPAGRGVLRKVFTPE